MAIGTPSTLGFASSDTTYSTTALTISANIPANSLVVVLTGNNNNQDGSTTSAISGVSEGSKNYSNAVASVRTASASVQFYEIWYFYYATGNASATISVAYSKNCRLKVLHAVSITGIKSVSPLDKTNSSVGSSTSASTASGTLSQANEIIIAGAFVDSGSAYAANSPFTNSYNNTNSVSQFFTLDYDIVSATTTVTHAPSWTGSAPYNAVLATFIGAAPVVSRTMKRFMRI